MNFLHFLESVGLSEWIAQSDFGYPIMLTFHSIGLAAVVGVTSILSLRVLGFARQVPISGFAKVTPFAVWGFVINAISGVMLFMSDATRLITNWPFFVKMICVIIGAVLFRFLSKNLNLDAFRTQPNGAVTTEEPLVTQASRQMAIALIVTWLVAIVTGRLIAYVLDAASLGL